MSGIRFNIAEDHVTPRMLIDAMQWAWIDCMDEQVFIEYPATETCFSVVKFHNGQGPTITVYESENDTDQPDAPPNQVVDPKKEMIGTREKLFNIRQQMSDILANTPAGTELYRNLSKAIDRVNDSINAIYIEKQE